MEKIQIWSLCWKPQFNCQSCFLRKEKSTDFYTYDRNWLIMCGSSAVFDSLSVKVCHHQSISDVVLSPFSGSAAKTCMYWTQFANPVSRAVLCFRMNVFTHGHEHFWIATSGENLINGARMQWEAQCVKNSNLLMCASFNTLHVGSRVSLLVAGHETVIVMIVTKRQASVRIEDNIETPWRHLLTSK